MSSRHSPRTWLVALATSVLVVSGVAIAQAATPSTPAAGLVSTCVKKSDGSIRVTATGSCKKGYSLLQWNAQGLVGAAGPKGDSGAAALAGKRCPVGGLLIGVKATGSPDCAVPVGTPCNDGDGTTTDDRYHGTAWTTLDGVAYLTDDACAGSKPDLTDQDADGVLDTADNCITTANSNQADTDVDGHGDVCDPCPAVATSASDAGKDGALALNADHTPACGAVTSSGVRWFHLELAANATPLLSVGPDGSFDVILKIYAADGTTLLATVNPPDSKGATVTWDSNPFGLVTASGATAYYAVVSSASGPAAPGATGLFTISIEAV